MGLCFDGGGSHKKGTAPETRPREGGDEEGETVYCTEEVKLLPRSDI